MIDLSILFLLITCPSLHQECANNLNKFIKRKYKLTDLKLTDSIHSC